MTKFDALCTKARARGVHIEIAKVEGALQLRCFDPKLKKVIASTAFNPDQPDRAAQELADALLADI